MSEVECPYAVSTLSFGYVVQYDELFEENIESLVDLYLNAINRGISITQSSEEEVCKQLSSQIPTIEWQRKFIMWYTTVWEADKRLISDYVSHGFSFMNRKLRDNPEAQAPINKVIARAPPLTTNIIVFRYLDAELPLGRVVITGYLSTTFDALYTVKTACKNKKHSVMRISIPAGTRCLYIPS